MGNSFLKKFQTDQKQKSYKTFKKLVNLKFLKIELNPIFETSVTIKIFLFGNDWGGRVNALNASNIVKHDIFYQKRKIIIMNINLTKLNWMKTNLNE